MPVVDPRATVPQPRRPADAELLPRVPAAPRVGRHRVAPGPGPRSARPALIWFSAAAATLVLGTAAVLAESVFTPRPPTLDESYVGSVHENSTLTERDVEDEALVRTGREVCADLDRQPTLAHVLDTMRELGQAHRWSEDDVAAVVGSAIGAYCPRHIPVLGH